MNAYKPIRLAVIFVHMLALSLLACSGSEHGNPESSRPDGGKKPDGGKPFGNGRPDGGPGDMMLQAPCEFQLRLRPDAGPTVYRCALAGDEFSNGPGEWSCTCQGGEVKTLPLKLHDPVSASCEAALAKVCGIDLEQRNFCEHARGMCWPNPDGDDAWDCMCSNTREASPLATVHADSCEAAAFAHCAKECEDPTGKCTPSTETDRFECSCDYFGVSRDTPAADCSFALAGCNPQLNNSYDDVGLACSGFAGFCDQFDSELRCRCADGSTHAKPLADLEERSAESCSAELFTMCGSGASEAEASECSVDQGDARHCTASLRFADGHYLCHCESLNACNEEYDVRDSELASATCAEALAACSAADSALTHPAAPECAPDPGPRSCDGPSSNDRVCNVHFLSEGHFHCQCFLDQGLNEIDFVERDVDADDCDAALDLCIDFDARDR
jgi:hypothetical protein